ncbi:MAG: hypothetical protein C4527_18955, partial [Candidatus Omnitrophota bacterium]
EYEIVREGAGGAGGDPESLQSNAAWTGNPELSINLEQAGATSVGILQFDWVTAGTNGAYDPQAGSLTAVDLWEIY